MEFKVKRSDELYHFGILGMKWGVRRFQNEDGSLTREGRERYGASKEKYNSEIQKYRKMATQYSVSREELRKQGEIADKAKKKMNRDRKTLKKLEIIDRGRKRHWSGKSEPGFVSGLVDSALSTIGWQSLRWAKRVYNVHQSAGQIMSRNSKTTDADLVNLLTVIGGLSLGSLAIKKYADHVHKKEVETYQKYVSEQKKKNKKNEKKGEKADDKNISRSGRYPYGS